MAIIIISVLTKEKNGHPLQQPNEQQINRKNGPKTLLVNRASAVLLYGAIPKMKVLVGFSDMLLEELTRREKLICRKYWHDCEDIILPRLLVNKHIHHLWRCSTKEGITHRWPRIMEVDLRN